LRGNAIKQHALGGNATSDHSEQVSGSS
jgi:hypothetical protein